MIRSLWIVTLGGLITAYYVVKISLLSAFASEKTFCAVCDSASRNWARKLLKLSSVSVVVEGVVNLERSNSCVVVANHESWFDVFALAGWLPVSAKFVGKRELADIPLFGSSWQACGHVAIDRRNRDSAIRSLNSVVEKMRHQSMHVVMFAEGTRSATGKLQPFKKGPFILAIEAGTPIIPVAIIGSRKIMPKGSYSIGKGEIKIRIGKPIDVLGKSYEDRDYLRTVAQRKVAELKEE